MKTKKLFLLPLAGMMLTACGGSSFSTDVDIPTGGTEVTEQDARANTSRDVVKACLDTLTLKEDFSSVKLTVDLDTKINVVLQDKTEASGEPGDEYYATRRSIVTANGRISGKAIVAFYTPVSDEDAFVSAIHFGLEDFKFAGTITNTAIVTYSGQTQKQSIDVKLNTPGLKLGLDYVNKGEGNANYYLDLSDASIVALINHLKDVVHNVIGKLGLPSAALDSVKASIDESISELIDLVNEYSKTHISSADFVEFLTNAGLSEDIINIFSGDLVQGLLGLLGAKVDLSQLDFYAQAVATILSAADNSTVKDYSGEESSLKLGLSGKVNKDLVNQFLEEDQVFEKFDLGVAFVASANNPIETLAPEYVEVKVAANRSVDNLSFTGSAKVTFTYNDFSPLSDEEAASYSKSLLEFIEAAYSAFRGSEGQGGELDL